MSNGTATNVRVGIGALYYGDPATIVEPTGLTAAWDASWTLAGYTEAGHEATVAPKLDPVEVGEEVLPIDYQESGRDIKVAFNCAEITAENIKRALNGGTITSIPDSTGTVVGGTITAATTDVFSTAAAAAHGLVVNQTVKFTGTITGIVPAITSGQAYYVKSVPSADTFTISASISGGVAGATLDITTGGTATIMTKYRDLKTYEPSSVGVLTNIALGWQSQDSLERWIWRKCLQTGSVNIARRKGAAKALIPMEFKVLQPAGGVQPFKAIFGV
jgi:hypothetical protein